MHRIVLSTAVTASLLAPRIADACSPPACRSGAFTPAHGTTVPANLPAVYWQPVQSFNGDLPPPDASDVLLATTANPSVALPITLTALPDGDYLVVPDQPLVEGTDYVITDKGTCGATMGPSSTFHVGPAAPLPTVLGVLDTSEGNVASLEVATSSGSCSTDVTAAQDSIDLTLAPEAIPWLNALHFETLVDGAVWRPQSAINTPVAPGASWNGQGADLVYSVCATTDQGAATGVEAGIHTVTMRASLPGSTTLVTSTATMIDLDCSDPDGPDGPDGPGDAGGCSTSNAGHAPWILLAFVPLVSRRRKR